MSLTAQKLRSVLSYEPKTGVFVWLKSRRQELIGQEAGAPHSGGYRRIRIGSTDYFAHRLAWLYMHGQWPEQDIDHINRIKTDNRIANLRDVSPTKNLLNSGIWKNNSSGVKGVDFYQNKWRAKALGKTLGVFVNRFDAICKRKSWEAKCQP